MKPTNTTVSSSVIVVVVVAVVVVVVARLHWDRVLVLRVRTMARASLPARQMALARHCVSVLTVGLEPTAHRPVCSNMLYVAISCYWYLQAETTGLTAMAWITTL